MARLCSLLLLFTLNIAAFEPVQLLPTDRILVLAPHPDDEVLGCGGVIQQAVEMKLPLRVVFLTNGDENQWSFVLYRKHPVLLPGSVRAMGDIRHDEALAAATALGVPREHLTFLGYPDFGTLAIWNSHWDDATPYRSLLTRVTAVPYGTALRPHAPHKGEEILRDLTSVLHEFRPTKVFVSHPADHNTDHRALYLFTRVALWNLETEMQPEVFPYLTHFVRWPRPAGLKTDAVIEPPKALRDLITWRSLSLATNEVARKLTALQAHRSQYRASRKYLSSFIRANELFGDFSRGSAGARESSDNAPEELTDEERATFVGIEGRTMAIENQQLVLTIALSRPLAHQVEAAVYAFGYRRDTPFATMPKLHIKLGEGGFVTYDQNRKLPRDTVTINRNATRVTLRIPLAALGLPERILTSARTYLRDLPLDWVSWRALEMDKPANSDKNAPSGGSP